MRAFVLSKYKTAVHEAEMPEPTVGEHDVLVRVEAAGLNQLDEKIRAGSSRSSCRSSFRSSSATTSRVPSSESEQR